MRTSTLRLLATLPLAALVVGCSVDPGNLEIPFSIGAASVTCESADVATVSMVLTEITEEGSDQPVMYSGDAPCTDGSVTFTGVNPGNYDITVSAISSTGVTVFDNLGPTSLHTVEALEGQSVTTDVVKLTPTPARVLIRWDLSKGGAQVQCGGVDTKQFQVSAFTADGITELLSAEPLACDSDPDESPFHVVQDPLRTLDGTQVALVQVTPQDAMGGTVGTPSEVMLAGPPGRGESIKIVVYCEDEVCTACLDGDIACP
ncbi:MAG: hypothetical protein H6711_16105 [Myxococcales bacterium]|nr:hypothetical protein [Myxococcales bacterium]